MSAGVYKEGASRVWTRPPFFCHLESNYCRRHKLNHDPVAKFPCAVANCSKKFQREDLLMRHMEKKYVLPPLRAERLLMRQSDLPHRRVYEAIIRERRRVSPGRHTSVASSPAAGRMAYGLPNTAPYQLMYTPYPVSSQDIATLLTSIGTSAPTYENPLVEPITSDPYSLTTSVTDPSIMYPIAHFRPFSATAERISSPRIVVWTLGRISNVFSSR